MAGTAELSSFVNKFVNLWQSGRNATLHVETNAGSAFINLRLDLGQAQQQYGLREGGNSRQRRKARRAAERQTAATDVTAKESE